MKVKTFESHCFNITSKSTAVFLILLAFIISISSKSVFSQSKFEITFTVDLSQLIEQNI